ncbi:hypothetical protein BJV82DRAFT_509183, partial [Fennellomyces sp. T-0311]
LQGIKFAGDIGYAEIKCIKEGNNKYVVNEDLVRLGNYCKEMIQTGKVHACLAIQVVSTAKKK